MDKEQIENDYFEEFSASGLSKEDFREVVDTEIRDLRQHMRDRISDW